LIMRYAVFTVVCSSILSIFLCSTLPKSCEVKPPVSLTFNYLWDILKFY